MHPEVEADLKFLFSLFGPAVRVKRPIHGRRDRWIGDKVADNAILRRVIKARSFPDAEFDRVMRLLSEAGYGLETIEDEYTVRTHEIRLEQPV